MTSFELDASIIHNIRWNIYSLVKKGFTREELYSMPVGEFEEYIRYLNEEIEAKNQAISNGAVPDDEISLLNL